MRHGWGTHFHCCGNIADTFLGVAKEPENTESGAVTEHGKDVGCHKKLLFRWDGRHQICQIAAVVMEVVAGFCVDMLMFACSFCVVCMVLTHC